MARKSKKASATEKPKQADELDEVTLDAVAGGTVTVASSSPTPTYSGTGVCTTPNLLDAFVPTPYPNVSTTSDATTTTTTTKTATTVSVDSSETLLKDTSVTLS